MNDLPSYELVQRFMHEAGFDVPDPDKEPAFPSSKHMKLASRLIQYGMDCELEDCCLWLKRNLDDWDDRIGDELRATRRPKPPSETDQALELVSRIEKAESTWAMSELGTIRHALERLKKLEQLND